MATSRAPSTKISALVFMATSVRTPSRDHVWENKWQRPRPSKATGGDPEIGTLPQLAAKLLPLSLINPLRERSYDRPHFSHSKRLSKIKGLLLQGVGSPRL